MGAVWQPGAVGIYTKFAGFNPVRNALLSKDTFLSLDIFLP